MGNINYDDICLNYPLKRSSEYLTSMLLCKIMERPLFEKKEKYQFVDFVTPICQLNSVRTARGIIVQCMYYNITYNSDDSATILLC